MSFKKQSYESEKQINSERCKSSRGLCGNEYVKATWRQESPDILCPLLSACTDVPQPSLQRSHSPHPSQKCTLGDWEDGACAKPTICRRLEINDRPKPSGSPSHSTASVSAVTGPPNLPFSLKSMCETPASHAGVCLRETWSGFGRWSTALYSGERAGGTAWWSQLSPHWLRQPTRGVGELVDSRWIRLESSSSSTLFD